MEARFKRIYIILTQHILMSYATSAMLLLFASYLMLSALVAQLYELQQRQQGRSQQLQLNLNQRSVARMVSRAIWAQKFRCQPMQATNQFRRLYRLSPKTFNFVLKVIIFDYFHMFSDFVEN